MKTPFDIIDDVYTIVAASQLKTTVSGSIYKMQRPDNSTKEDIVINALPVSPGTPDLCTVNVNIYVPDLQVNINGKAQQQPDFVRMKYLADMAKDILQEYYGDSFYFFIVNQGILREQQINQHIINSRIEYRSFTT